MVGVDNLRHDVVLSPRLVEATTHVKRLIVLHGELEGLLAAEAPLQSQAPSWVRNAAAPGPEGSAPRGKSGLESCCSRNCM